HLPDVPGEEVLRCLRAEPRTRGLPVVVISADVTPGQMDRMLGAGVAAYLTKPIDVRRLMEIIDATAGVEAGCDA
ncbi:MAG: response regulator, partial [Armatimonadota bacterium]|nr:response regulator [Armatimonadota bacterium]